MKDGGPWALGEAETIGGPQAENNDKPGAEGTGNAGLDIGESL